MIALLAVAAAAGYLVGFLRGWCVGYDGGRLHSARWEALSETLRDQIPNQRAVEEAYRTAGAVSQADLRKAVDV